MVDKSSTMGITALSPADRSDWERLWCGYQEFYGVSLSSEATDANWARLLDPDEPIFGAIAILGGVKVGLAHWIFHRSTWSIGDYCYLQDLFVDKSARGHGLGRSLVEFVYDAALAHDCPRVYWLTHETNNDAQALYDRIAERSGFIQYKKLSPFGRKWRS